MRKGLEGNLVLDSGVIISILQGEYEEVFMGIRDRKIIPIVNIINLIEVYYVLCRKVGWEKATEIIRDLLDSNYFRIVYVDDTIMSEISKCKCKYPVSLGDCASIATASANKVKAVFRREKELEELNLDEVEFI
ncbi:MAG: type II toxin-antitoxin system VapC family toxin [Sulfolobus sp.]|nr:type II toxin-antitoxin system VapC family toxin [Sulfolobus sp.]